MPDSAENRFHREYSDFVVSRLSEAREQYRRMVAAMAAGHARYAGAVLRTAFHPYVISHSGLERMAHVCERMAILLEKSVRLYLEDLEVRRFFGLDERVEALILEAAPRHLEVRAAPVMRFDSFVSGDSVKFLEINTDGSSGMNDSNEIERRFLECALVREFRSRFPLAPLEMCPAVLEAILQSYRDSGGETERPLIAIVDWEGVKTAEEFLALVECWEAAGHRAVLADPRRLALSNGKLYHGRERVDVVYKRVLTAELLERWQEVQPLVEGYRRGAFCQVGPFLGDVLYDKGMLAFLRDERFADRFDAAERELIAACVPWTCKVVPRRVVFESEERDLLDLLRTRRERFVLKPSVGYGGKDVLLGSECPADLWEAALERAADRSFIAQELLPIPRIDLVDLELGRTVEKKLNVGQFLFAGRLGGLYCRVSDHSVINVSAGGATLPALVLEDVGPRGPGSALHLESPGFPPSRA